MSSHIFMLSCLYNLILYIPSTIFQLNKKGFSWVEPVLSKDKCVLLKDHNAVTQVRLEPAVPRSQVKHSTTEPLRSLMLSWIEHEKKSYNLETRLKVSSSYLEENMPIFESLKL